MLDQTPFVRLLAGAVVNEGVHRVLPQFPATAEKIQFDQERRAYHPAAQLLDQLLARDQTVPPVANRSSTSRTRCPAAIESACNWMVASPYSSA